MLNDMMEINIFKNTNEFVSFLTKTDVLITFIVNDMPGLYILYSAVFNLHKTCIAYSVES